MTKTKRPTKYEKPLILKEGVEFIDLIGVALQPPKKAAPKVKRTKAKKK